MNKDLIETPRFNFFIGDEVLLKGKIVGFDVDENSALKMLLDWNTGKLSMYPTIIFILQTTSLINPKLKS
ncbi:Uncharacterised protein [Streptococcus pneumoniae]|nr:Uncharacterised protein [Streptococcus pneumoniae]